MNRPPMPASRMCSMSRSRPAGSNSSMPRNGVIIGGTTPDKGCFTIRPFLRRGSGSRAQKRARACRVGITILQGRVADVQDRPLDEIGSAALCLDGVDSRPYFREPYYAKTITQLRASTETNTVVRGELAAGFGRARLTPS